MYLDNDVCYFSDERCTFNYMQERYDLDADDVQTCIKSVLDLYGFSMKDGYIYACIGMMQEIKSRFFDVISCIMQLSNMHVFFDNPN